MSAINGTLRCSGIWLSWGYWRTCYLRSYASISWDLPLFGSRDEHQNLIWYLLRSNNAWRLILMKDQLFQLWGDGWMQSAVNEWMSLLLSYWLVCDQFVSNLGGTSYKREELIVTSRGWKRGNQIAISLLGVGQGSCRLICNVWWILKNGWRIEP